MNPLTLVKRIQKINSKEAALGISDEASWHTKYKESAYVFVGGIPFDLTEGDLLAVFAQYGEIVDVNLVRDKGTGKSKGFAFIAFEDQRSTNLAVDNLNGAQVLGRIIRVDHVSNYKKKEEEDEEAEQQKREARGVCRAFQRGECNRGAGCKFSHDEQRAANTGWGAEDKSSSWGHDKFDGSTRNKKRSKTLNQISNLRDEGMELSDKDASNSGIKGQSMLKTIDRDNKDLKGRPESKKERNRKQDRNGRGTEKSSRHDTEPISRDAYDRREEKRYKRHESEYSPREDREDRGRDRRSAHDRDSSSHRHRERDEGCKHYNR